jgi:hypothetical protein
MLLELLLISLKKGCLASNRRRNIAFAGNMPTSGFCTRTLLQRALFVQSLLSASLVAQQNHTCVLFKPAITSQKMAFFSEVLTCLLLPVQLGDLVDRGPSSLEVVQYMHSLQVSGQRQAASTAAHPGLLQETHCLLQFHSLAQSAAVRHSS